MTDYRTNPPTSPSYRPDPYVTTPPDRRPVPTESSSMGFVLFVLGGIAVMLTIVWLTLGAMESGTSDVTPTTAEDVNVTIDNGTTSTAPAADVPAADVVEDQAAPAVDATTPEATDPAATDGAADPAATSPAPVTE